MTLLEITTRGNDKHLEAQFVLLELNFILIIII
jgi:hypothetical protein